MLLAQLGQHLVAQCTQLTPDQARDPKVGRREGGNILGELAAVELPLLAPAVEQLRGVEAEVAAQPVGVGGEPVIAPAVEHHGRIRADARLLQQAAQALLIDVLPSHGVVQIEDQFQPTAHGATNSDRTPESRLDQSGSAVFGVRVAHVNRARSATVPRTQCELRFCEHVLDGSPASLASSASRAQRLALGSTPPVRFITEASEPGK
jgi:hypothetical protein